MKKTKVAIQGNLGSFSHKATNELFKDAEVLSFSTFEEAIDALVDKKADLAVIPIANSEAGRVSGVHKLIFEKNVYIIKEYFLRVRHCLISNEKVQLKDIKRIFSHPQALAQCSKFIKKNKLEEVVWSDTADSVRHIVEVNSKHAAAIAPCLAAKIYGAKILKKGIENDSQNTTRFVVLSRKAQVPRTKKNVITSIFYSTKNIPAALFKSLSGFATEGINLIMIESFMPMKKNGKARFYLEFEGHPEDEKVARALEELKFYSQDFKILGVYKEEKHR